MAAKHNQPPTVEYGPVRDCPGYRVGTDGTVWSCLRFQGAGYGRRECRYVLSDRWKQLKPDRRKSDGRKRCTLRRTDGSYRRVYVATLVLEAFVGPCPEGQECCHEDGDCTNDSLSNLRYGTPTSNKADMIRHGTRLRGEQINTAKLTETKVRLMRRLRREGWSLARLSKRFHITETMASYVCSYKNWKHVP